MNKLRGFFVEKMAKQPEQIPQNERLYYERLSPRFWCYDCPVDRKEPYAKVNPDPFIG